MRIIDSGYAHFRAWNAVTALASENERERKRAMQTLRELGAASLPSLHAAARRTGAPQAQFAAAVVLHWLGDPSGLPLLLDALCWRLPATPHLARDLEASFVAIGAPDAVDALMRIWRQMVPIKENRRALKTICRIWTRVGDVRPLTLLVANADLIPELFEEFVPAFQDKALPYLAPLCSDPLIAHRSLAVRTLRHIPGEASIRMLVMLLRDTEAGVRALAAQSLSAMQRQEENLAEFSRDCVYAEILAALRAGYSSAQSIEILLRASPPPCEDLIQLVLRWNPAGSTTHDTLDAVLTALPVFATLPLVTGSARSTLHLQLASVLERRPEPVLMAAIARVLMLRGKTGAAADKQVHATLLPLLSHPDSAVRNEVANALAALGDPVGKQLLQLLAGAWPQGNWRDKLHLLLYGGTDVTQVASEAVLWFTRKSKETAEQWGVSAPSRPEENAQPPDPHLTALLRQLLDNALTFVLQASLTAEVEPTQDLCVACIRALLRQNKHTAQSAHRELVLALNFCRTGKMPSSANAVSNSTVSQLQARLYDSGEGVRMAAGQALIALYEARSFPLFLHCLYSPALAVRVTAIEFLGELADVRALFHLQRLAAHTEPVLAEHANAAITRIRNLNPDTMTLLRASSAADSRAQILLRPASGNTSQGSSDILLRPSKAPGS